VPSTHNGKKGASTSVRAVPFQSGGGGGGEKEKGRKKEGGSHSHPSLKGGGVEEKKRKRGDRVKKPYLCYYHQGEVEKKGRRRTSLPLGEKREERRDCKGSAFLPLWPGPGEKAVSIFPREKKKEKKMKHQGGGKKKEREVISFFSGDREKGGVCRISFF